MKGQNPDRARRYFSMLLLILFSALIVPFFFSPIAQDAPIATQGVTTFSDRTDFDHPVELAGEWRLSWISPSLAQPEAASRSVAIAVPGGWQGKAGPGGAILPSQGHAQYLLTVKNLPPQTYQIHLPIIQGASKLSINGVEMSRLGVIGNDVAGTRQDWRAQGGSFDHRGGDVTIAIEVASFGHRSNGIAGAPVIGPRDVMTPWIAKKWVQDALVQGSLMFIAVFGLIVFLFRREDRTPLHFALMGLLIMPITLVTGFDNLLYLVAPGLSFESMIAVSFCGAWLAILAIFTYTHLLFPQESKSSIYTPLAAAFCIGAFLQFLAWLFADSYTASLVSMGLAFVILPAFGYHIIVIHRAIRSGRYGAAPFQLGSAIFGASGVALLLQDGGVIPRSIAAGFNFAGFGFLILLISHIIVIAERWSTSITAAETLNDDLGQLLAVNSAVTSEDRLDTLLSRIVGVTTRILDAERSTLFLHDPKTKELWSLVAEGLEVHRIRIPDTSGIVGHVFASGDAANVSDAYIDARFNPVVDQETGFRTQHLLAAPVTARDGRKLGVLQALNSKSGRGFSQSDQVRLSSFAAQAAVALDNANLFSEVIASRNYNESILQSMSSGVVTLESDTRRARLNDSAARILGVEREAAEAGDARLFIEGTNPSLLADIDAVNAEAEAKYLLDHDLVTASGETVSANISIVPLHSGEETTGVLLMLDDISANKRLEGAMRRFMTQEVMDQVLAQKDELLFGHGCTASVLFADIRNFTTMAEKLTPRETVDMLNEIFTDLFDAVEDGDGVLDKYIGDAIMAVFGAPISSGKDARNAVKAAVRMQSLMLAINERRNGSDAAELRLGIGISSGEVIAGTIGSPKRMDYTVIGDSVNLASRLQDATKSYGCSIIVCERTAEEVKDFAELREVDTIQVKGRTRPERIFEVIGLRE